MRRDRSPFGLTRPLAPLASGSLRFSAVVLLFLLAACSPPSNPPRTASLDAPVQVATAPAVTERLARTIRVAGSLLAQDQAPLSIQVSGRVEHIAVDLGSRVRAGELVAEIDRRDYELGLQRAKASLAQARARLGLPLEGDDDEVGSDETPLVRQARAVSGEKRKELDRIRTLAEQKVASQSELETAQAAHEVALNAVEDALEEVRNRRAVLAQRRAEYDIARKQLTDTRLVAPFDGAIQERRVSVGEFVAAGTPIVTLVRVDPLRLQLEVPEREAPRVRLGQAVRVFVEGETNAHPGRIERLSPAITRDTRVLVVEAEVSAGRGLRPGSFARAEIVAEAEASAVTVPPRAVVAFAGIERLFVVENGRAVERFVTTGERLPDLVEVLTGVKAGESVVLDPGGLRNGQAVLPREPDSHATTR